MVFQDQTPPPYPITHFGVALGGGRSGASLTTDLSLAIPGVLSLSKSTRKQIWQENPFLEENPTEIMSHRNGNGNRNGWPRLELELKLNLPPDDEGPNSPAGSVESGSPPSSCVSSELSQDEAGSIMVVAGCRRCLMYVMMSEEESNCPRCNSPALLHVGDRPSATAAASGTATVSAKDLIN